MVWIAFSVGIVIGVCVGIIFASRLKGAHAVH